MKRRQGHSASVARIIAAPFDVLTRNLAFQYWVRNIIDLFIIPVLFSEIWSKILSYFF